MKIIAVNRRASFDYDITHRYTAGLVLLGSEVKSLRTGGVRVVGSFVAKDGHFLVIRGLWIKNYIHASWGGHDEERPRKILLKRKEYDRVYGELDHQSVVVERLFFSNKGYAKAVLAVGRGRKKYDKRAYIKERESKKDVRKIVRDN